MIALDTNVLVRFIVEDDDEQTERATRLIQGALAKDEPLFVSEVVLCEIVWVPAGPTHLQNSGSSRAGAGMGSVRPVFESAGIMVLSGSREYAA